MSSDDNQVYGALLYTLSVLRLLGISLALAFVPAVVLQVGVNGALAAIICCLGLSAIYNLIALLYETCAPKDLPWTLTLLFDFMVFPSIVIVFGVICLTTAEIGDGTPFTNKRRVLAFALLLALGILHMLSFTVYCIIVVKREKTTNKGSRRKSTLTARPRMMTTRDKYQLQRAAPPTTRRTSGAPSTQSCDVLPLYTPGDLYHSPPPMYKSTDDTPREEV